MYRRCLLLVELFWATECQIIDGKIAAGWWEGELCQSYTHSRMNTSLRSCSLFTSKIHREECYLTLINGHNIKRPKVNNPDFFKILISNFCALHSVGLICLSSVDKFSWRLPFASTGSYTGFVYAETFTTSKIFYNLQPSSLRPHKTVGLSSSNAFLF